MKSKTSSPIYLAYCGKSEDEIKNYDPAPMSLLYIGQALKDAGYRVRVFHLRDELPLVEAIKEERPLFVGFSSFISPTLGRTIAGSRFAHSQGVPVVWGGIFPTVLPELVLRDGCVDYVVVGEGEIAAVRLAEAIENREVPRGIPGVGYLDGEEFCLTTPEPPEMDLDQFGYGLELVDWNRYVVRNPPYAGVSIPISRGCPFRCGFCYNAMNPYRQKWRSHSAEYLKEIVSFFQKNYGVTGFLFSSDNTFGDPGKGRRIVESLDIFWRGNMNLSGFNEDFMDWAREHKCHSIGFGIESGSDRMLKLMRKGITSQMVRERLRLAKEKGLNTFASFMTMMPGETFDDMRQTWALMDELWEGELTGEMNISPYRAYPGTPFYEDSLKLGLQAPLTLTEWGTYDPVFTSHLGLTPEMTERIKLASLILYLTPRSRNPVPAWVRTILKKRLDSIHPRFPLEEAMYSAFNGYRRTRRFIGSIRG